jgi:hypothetical protein
MHIYVYRILAKSQHVGYLNVFTHIYTYGDMYIGKYMIIYTYR